MELRQLEYFAAVARHGHFGRAADEVYVTQSALSQQIARLEAELGLTLLIRTPKGVELTAAGADLNARAIDILGRVAEARAAVDDHLGSLRGVVRLAATPYDAQRVPDALIAFHEAHPGVRVALRHGSAAEVVELVGAGAVDLGVVAVHESEPRVPPAVAVRKLWVEPLVVLGTGLRAGAGIEALRGSAVILAERGTALRAVVAALCAEAGFSPLPVFETSDPDTVRRLAAAGLGVSIVPASWTHGAEAALVAGAEYAVALLVREEGRLPLRDLLAAHIVAFYDGGRGSPIQ